MPAPKTTIGRTVHFYERGRAQMDAGEPPCAATIAYVHSDRLINIGYLTHNGMHASATSIPLVPDGEATRTSPAGGFCVWPKMDAEPNAFELGAAARRAGTGDGY